MLVLTLLVLEPDLDAAMVGLVTRLEFKPITR
jgi:hypothetical protein